MKVYQGTISTTTTITRADTVFSLSIKGVTGTTTITTDGTLNGVASSSLALAAGDAITYAADITNPLEGISITTTGTYSITALRY